MTQALDAVLAEITAEEDPRQAFADIRRFDDILAGYIARLAEYRRETVKRIWLRDRHSLAQLADILGVNRARAGQLLGPMKDLGGNP